MVKGETGTLSLDVRTSVDKGVSTYFYVSVSVCVRRRATGAVRSEFSFSSFFSLWDFIVFLSYRRLILFDGKVLLIYLYFSIQTLPFFHVHYYFSNLCPLSVSQRRG